MLKLNNQVNKYIHIMHPAEKGEKENTRPGEYKAYNSDNVTVYKLIY